MDVWEDETVEMCTLYLYKEYARILLKGRMTGQQHLNEACIKSSLRREDLWQFLPLPLLLLKCYFQIISSLSLLKGQL